MKKILSCILLCAMLLSALSVGIFAEDADSITADTSWYDNRADGQTEFTLKNENELAGFNTLINSKVTFEDMTVYLGVDLDMKDYAWNSYGIFEGTFDGKGHRISNLTPVNHSNGQRRGMFGYASGTIRNFSLINPDVGNSSTASVGAIVGDRNQTKLKDQPLTIENVHVVNGKVTGGTSVGGILGNTNDGGNVDLTTDVVTVKNCSFSGTITGAGNVGGMVGYAVNVNTLNIEDCVVSGTVSGSSTYVGGVLGYTKGNTTIRNCSVKGTVSGTGNGTGGLVGYVENGSITSASGMKMEIDSCHVNVQIEGAGNHKGGLVGRVHTTKSTLNFTIQNSLAEGKIVLSANQTYMAGIVAWMNYSGQTLNASFENVITAMECNSNMDGTPHSNFKAFGSAHSDKTDNNKITVSLTNVWGNSDILNGRGEYDSNTVTVSSDSTNYGLKTTEELKAIELEGWTIRPAKYPLPNKLISEGETFVWGYQEKANDSTTDYRFVAVLALADTKTLADYSDVGFVVTLINDTDGTVLYRDERVSSKVVYTQITGTGTDGECISYTPQYYGDYLFALVLKDVDNDAEFTVKLTPYTTDANGNDRLGRETEITVKKTNDAG